MERRTDDGPPPQVDAPQADGDRADAAPNDAPSPAAALRATLAHATPGLRRLSDDEASRRPAPGRWSPKEVLGHLVDSATNNHGRFVRAQLADALVFDGYDQDAWVRVQRYTDAPWSDLVDAFSSLNRQIARTMEAASAHERLRPRPVHALDRLAWRAVPRDQATTLQDFMEDYVGHLRHHLAQIDPALADAPGAPERGS